MDTCLHCPISHQGTWGYHVKGIWCKGWSVESGYNCIPMSYWKSPFPGNTNRVKSMQTIYSLTLYYCRLIVHKPLKSFMRRIKEFVLSEFFCERNLILSNPDSYTRKRLTIIMLLFFSIPAGTSSHIKDLLTGLLKRNPKDRMDFGKYTNWFIQLWQWSDMWFMFVFSVNNHFDNYVDTLNCFRWILLPSISQWENCTEIV